MSPRSYHRVNGSGRLRGLLSGRDVLEYIEQRAPPS
jgi:hypothetical protein